VRCQIYRISEKEKLRETFSVLKEQQTAYEKLKDVFKLRKDIIAICIQTTNFTVHKTMQTLFNFRVTDF
jgi:butyrate kinase